MLTHEQKVSLAQSAHLNDFVALLTECKTKIPSMITENQWTSIVNALTLEVEANLIGRLLAEIESIKATYNHPVS